MTEPGDVATAAPLTWWWARFTAIHIFLKFERAWYSSPVAYIFRDLERGYIGSQNELIERSKNSEAGVCDRLNVNRRYQESSESIKASAFDDRGLMEHWKGLG